MVNQKKTSDVRYEFLASQKPILETSFSTQFTAVIRNATGRFSVLLFESWVQSEYGFSHSSSGAPKARRGLLSSFCAAGTQILL